MSFYRIDHKVIFDAGKDSVTLTTAHPQRVSSIFSHRLHPDSCILSLDSSSAYLCVMQLPSTLLENAVNEFAKLPGIGKKTALRMVLHLLKQDAEAVTNFSETIARMRRDIKFCQRCFNVSDGDICSICANSMRNQRMICVVENIRDVIAIESTQQFNGTYHVLGGIISPLDGIGPDQLNIESLVHRIEKEQTEELIFALSPNIQGDTTIYYIQKKIQKF